MTSVGHWLGAEAERLALHTPTWFQRSPGGLTIAATPMVSAHPVLGGQSVASGQR